MTREVGNPCQLPLAKGLVVMVVVVGTSEWCRQCCAWCRQCTLVQQTLHHCVQHHHHHMTRDLPALGRELRIGVGWRMNQHFRNLSLPLVKAPAKGQYETKLQSQAPQSPCRLSKGCCQPTLRLTNALVTKRAIGGREGQLGVECQTGG